MSKDIKIGKFTLESLTTGMYSDHMIIYREYIQNSTDAIDDAIQSGLLRSRDEGIININLDRKNRSLSITDNGTGIYQTNVWNKLCDIGSSSKDFSKQRGFRGIGRLGGLSYAEKLQFVTSVQGENKKSIITWDCLKLKQMLRPGNYENYDLTMVIQEVTKIETMPEDEDNHYFTVKLVNIEKQYIQLIDEVDVRSYIEQVAPIPFHAQYFVFYHDSEIGIKKQLEKIKKPLEEYNVYINKDPNPVYKPYKNYVKAGKGENEKRDNVTKIEYIEEYDETGNLIFWGWYGITGFLGYVKDNKVSGLRVRKKNILIGDSKTLDDFFSQSRFNKWFIGEIYIYDEDIIPNARRDDFEKNQAYMNFRSNLEKYTKEILSKIPPSYSDYNAASKNIQKRADELEQIEKTVSKGISSEAERKNLHSKRDQIQQEILESTEKLKKASKKIDVDLSKNAEFLISKATEIHEQAKSLENDIINADYQLLKSKALSGYSKDVKRALIKVFEVLDSELDSDQSQMIQNKILESLKTNSKKDRK